MQAQFMVRPSTFLQTGILVESFGNVSLFKFSTALHERRAALLEKQKSIPLTPEESAEYEGLCDLNRIFTHINAQLATTAQWCPLTPDSSSAVAPNSDANLVKP